MFTNDVSIVNAILNLRAGSTKHLTVVSAVFSPHSNRHDMVKTNRFLDFINRQLLKLFAAHITGIVALVGNFLHICVIKHKVVIGTLNAFTRVVPVVFSFREATRGLLAFLECATTFVRAKLLRMTMPIREAVATLLANKPLRVFSELMRVYAGLVPMSSPKSTDRGCGYIKVFTDFFYSCVFFVVKTLKIFLSYSSGFSSLHGLIIAQAIPKYKGSTRLGYAYGLKNINKVKWSARTGYTY